MSIYDASVSDTDSWYCWAAGSFSSIHLLYCMCSC